MNGRRVGSKCYLFIAWLLAISVLLSAQVAWAVDQIGQVVWVKGVVHAISASQTRELQRRSPIYVGDTLETGVDATGQIVFTDGSQLSLKSNTRLALDKYHYNAKGPATENTFAADLVTGGFRTVTGLISQTHPKGYAVKTPVATIGVRGTDYALFFQKCNAAANQVHQQCGLSLRLDRGAIFAVNDAGKVELNQAKSQVFAQITGLHIMPQIVNAPAPALVNQPVIVAAPPAPPTNTPPPTGGGTVPTGTSGSKNTATFCIH